MTSRAYTGPSWSAASFFSIVLGTWGTAVALAPTPVLQLAFVAPLLLAALSYWMLLDARHWMVAFFSCLLLLPPLPLPGGNSGLHIAPLFAGAGVLMGMIWIREWRSWAHPLTVAFVVFLAVLTESLALAAVYSGWEIAAGSLARVGLFAIGVFVFLYSYAGPLGDRWNDMRFARLLFWMGVAGALFACADFYFQLPAPAGYGEQFIYLNEGVLRRAQGLFYEASTLGNLCAFFLVMVVVSLFRRREQAPCSRPALLFGGLALSAALMFSYSRASLLNLGVATCVLAWIRFRQFRRSLLAMLAAIALGGIAIHFTFPSLSTNYWSRLLASFSYFGSADQVLSGRLGHWQTLIDFLLREPWHVLFGVGYKTLPYSNFIGTTVIADNTYLGLLVETGVVGLAAFIGLNVVILRTGWRALRSQRPTASFLGEWIFCFWCGQMIQMLSGDLITYWRVLPVYFCVLGAAARQAQETFRVNPTTGLS